MGYLLELSIKFMCSNGFTKYAEFKAQDGWDIKYNSNEFYAGTQHATKQIIISELIECLRTLLVLIVWQHHLNKLN